MTLVSQRESRERLSRAVFCNLTCNFSKLQRAVNIALLVYEPLDDIKKTDARASLTRSVVRHQGYSA